MTEKKVILVTGVAGYWGKRLAIELITRPGYHVMGLDSEKPEPEIQGLDFIQADIRNSLISDLLTTEGVDTVCHLAFQETEQLSEAAFEYNVMGTTKLFGACSQSNVKKIVVKSSMETYGAKPDNSSFLREEQPLKGNQSSGYIRDLVEIEAFCNGFRMQSPEIILTILRFPSIIGPTADTPMTRFLKEPLTPVLFGFDPMIQIIHEEDVIGALVYAVENDIPGIFNVAAEGVMPFLKMMRIAGKQPLPVFHLFAYWGSDLFTVLGLQSRKYLPIELDYIRFPWVGDLAKMHEIMGFAPHYTAEEALREFAGYQRTQIYKPESATMEYDEERLRDTIERRKRARERRSQIFTAEDELGVLANEDEGEM